MKLYLGEVGTALEIWGIKLVMYAPSAERERGVHDSVLEEPFFIKVGRAKHTSSPWEKCVSYFRRTDVSICLRMFSVRDCILSQDFRMYYIKEGLQVKDV